MKVIKSLNNNIVLAETEKNKEVIIFGTGIGFKKKKGDLVNASLAKKTFYPEKSIQASQLLEQISAEVLTVTEEIIVFGEELLKRKLNQSILFSLSDHLQFAINRDQNKNYEDNPLQWEIPTLYNEEYKVGKGALKIIENRLGHILPKIEASFIALHFVNAQIDGHSLGDTMEIMKVIKKIIKIIQRLFDINLDKTTINYSRFITHLRYFIARHKMNKSYAMDMDKSFREIIQEKYKKSYNCCLVIKEMLENEYNWGISNDEIIYLTIHIERIVRENK
ncbi:PRD domain-containing protein [Senegalia massiliensis]|uniref:PRD domain-containing protein n=1 Tax=Senegalia massiliensis TaxID=1720316 RepID=UPI00191C593F